jgi:uncharacterized damage-inducible protein DinB
MFDDRNFMPGCRSWHWLFDLTIETRKEQDTMTVIDSLTTEFAHEAQTTRKHLERMPSDKLDWRPHEKSFTACALASHIVDCIRWADSIFNADELDVNPATYEPYQATSVDDLLKTFDEVVVKCKDALAGADDEALSRPWRLKMMGRSMFEKSRGAVFRDFTLSHLIHHRGQLSVYLRLLDIPVPGSYGPSADEQTRGSM